MHFLTISELAVQFTTSYAEEGIMKIVLTILMHLFKPDGIKEKNKSDFSIWGLFWVSDVYITQAIVSKFCWCKRCVAKYFCRR